MQTKQSTPTTTYHITVNGRVDANWAEYLGGLAIMLDDDAEKATTTLSGTVVDQAALMGMLNNLYGLGFSILSVNCESTEKQSAFVYQGGNLATEKTQFL